MGKQIFLSATLFFYWPHSPVKIRGLQAAIAAKHFHRQRIPIFSILSILFQSRSNSNTVKRIETAKNLIWIDFIILLILPFGVWQCCFVCSVVYLTVHTWLFISLCIHLLCLLPVKMHVVLREEWISPWKRYSAQRKEKVFRSNPMEWLFPKKRHPNL